jgi:hypothetical protein
MWTKEVFQSKEQPEFFHPYEEFILYLINGLDKYWDSRMYQIKKPFKEEIDLYFNLTSNDKTIPASEVGFNLTLSNTKGKEAQAILYTQLPPEEEWPSHLERFYSLVYELLSDYPTFP